MTEIAAALVGFVTAMVAAMLASRDETLVGLRQVRGGWRGTRDGSLRDDRRAHLSTEVHLLVRETASHSYVVLMIEPDPRKERVLASGTSLQAAGRRALEALDVERAAAP